ncbi:MAG: hypothetical protein J6A97_07100 [Clostridia bacterium]|nr:hypothetical protein [Clostridia bacterium]
MSDFENKSALPLSEESVDDILAGILNPDGSFNDEFNGLLKKYVGGDVGENPVSVSADISDRRDEAPVTRIEYEEPGDISFSARKDADERIEEKIPESVRSVYAEAAASVQRPEFTSTGDVRYPVMGSGASEERVIYDAEWEETARKEAQRLQRVRQDRMLRGDSTYVRSYYGDAPVYGRNPYTVNPYATDRAPASEYIDPLSRDDDFERVTENSQYYSSSKKSFFPEGFSAAQRNNYASGGKTERTRSVRNDFAGAPAPRDTSWLQIEEKPQKKRGLFGRKKTSPKVRENAPSVEETIERLEREKQAQKAPPETENAPVRVSPADGEDLSAVEKETEGLRSTVAEIVDKYNKRSEEDERRRIEEEARLEEERREAELRERRRLEEIRQIKENMSPELKEAVESADSEDDFDEYEDFSTEPREEKKKEAPRKVFGVVFDPAAFDAVAENGEEFTEKITSDS